MNTKTVLALTASAIMTTEARMGLGACPEASAVQVLDKARFAGKWYEIKRDASFTYEMGQECETQEYKLNHDGDLDLYFRAMFPMMAFTYQGVDGVLYQCDDVLDSGATCEASMAKSEKRYPFSVLATDYDNWAVHYNCMEGLGIHVSSLNIVSK